MILGRFLLRTESALEPAVGLQPCFPAAVIRINSTHAVVRASLRCC